MKRTLCKSCEQHDNGAVAVKPVLLIVIIFFISCAEDMKPYEKGNAASERKILVAGHTSEFRENIISGLINNLEPEGYYFKVTGLSTLKNENIDDYDVVLLVSVFMAGKINDHVTRFLEDNGTDPRVIVFYTYGNQNNPPPGLEGPGKNADVVTSASESEDSDRLVEELISLIKRRF